MELTNLKQAREHEVREWLFKTMPDITPYQKDYLYEHLRFSPFKFYKVVKNEKPNMFWRLTILPFGIVFLLLILTLPLKLILTGRWAYNEKNLGWFINWARKVNIKW
jgi:hypothetical protein